MNIVEPYAKLLTPSDLSSGKAMLQNIEYASRVSHRSEEAQTEELGEKFLRAVVVGHGDWSVTEHQSAQVEFLVDRGITHEIVRHRLFSYTQESTRFVNYDKKMPPSFIYPDVLYSIVDSIEPHWGQAIESAECAYKLLLKEGWRPQEARSVLPNALAAKLIMTGNLRAWRWFLLMRTTKETHPQMKQVTIPLLAQFKERVPILFEDIEPNATQINNARLAH